MSYQQIIASYLAKDAETVAKRSDPAFKARAAFAGQLAGPVLQPFEVGALGNFPYYWQDPTTLNLNAKTYAWISAGLKASTAPLQLDGPFTNLYIDALSKVFYSLSSTDQAQLNRDRQNAVDQQGTLLLAWKDAFGSIPQASPPLQPIDLVLQIITTRWASPPVTLTQLQTSPNLRTTLNTMPPSGQTVLVPLANYLSALNQGIPLLNQTVMNAGYLQEALAAVQNPTRANGAVMTSDGRLQPAFAVATPLAQILAGLHSKDPQTAFSLDMVVAPTPQELIVTMADQSQVATPAADFLTIEMGDRVNRFQDALSSSGTTRVRLDFSGVTMVYFGPVAFSQSTSQSWYWRSPIAIAIQNQGRDVTGFKFSPTPQIDFSTAGPFGFLTGVSISLSPVVTVVHRGPEFQVVARSFENKPTAALSFLGQRLSASIDESSRYLVSTTVDPGTQSTQLDFVPAASAASSLSGASVAADSMASTAYVLGVLPSYPVS